MKKLAPIIIFLILSLNVFAFTETSELRSNYALVIINILAAVLVLLISVDLYKFIHITRKNPSFVLAYFIVALLLFSSVINIFYYFSGSDMQFLPVYFIDRLIILVMLIVIYSGFKKFRKMLSTKI